MTVSMAKGPFVLSLSSKLIRGQKHVRACRFINFIYSPPERGIRMCAGQIYIQIGRSRELVLTAPGRQRWGPCGARETSERAHLSSANRHFHHSA